MKVVVVVAGEDQKRKRKREVMRKTEWTARGRAEDKIRRGGERRGGQNCKIKTNK